MRRLLWGGVGVIALLVILVGWHWFHGRQRPRAERAPPLAVQAEPLTLFTTLPLASGEMTAISSSLSEAQRSHWLRGWLEQRYRLNVVESLAMPDARSLNAERLLLLAQPRPLTGPEDVALDNWVRDGGQVLLFVDPLPTWRSRSALEPGRRPNVTLMSSLLDHWGLALSFDPQQPAGERTVDLGGGKRLPVNLPGMFQPRSAEGDKCSVRAGVLAECRIGKGRAVIVADTALLEPTEDPRLLEQRTEAFAWLARTAFAL